MKSVRLIPVVILAVGALLVLKTLGLVTTGGYILGGVATVQAEEAAAPGGDGMAADASLTLPSEPTIQDASPTLDDTAPTLAQSVSDGEHPAMATDGEPGSAPMEDHGAPSPTAESEHKAADGALMPGLQLACPPSGPSAPMAHADDAAMPMAADAAAPMAAAPMAADAPADGHDMAASDGSFAASVSGPDCVTLVDARPTQVGPDGKPVPLAGENGQSMSEKALLERLAERRTELDTFQQQLDLRASLVEAAEKKIEERQATLQALETQISTLVDQRKEMETGQFAGIITLYENMKPKDAANIFNTLDMEVLLRVAKGMNPRKMSPILAAMDPARAQELTIRMAALADQPPEEMTAADLSALPQIVGQ